MSLPLLVPLLPGLGLGARVALSSAQPATPRLTVFSGGRKLSSRELPGLLPGARRWTTLDELPKLEGPGLALIECRGDAPLSGWAELSSPAGGRAGWNCAPPDGGRACLLSAFPALSGTGASVLILMRPAPDESGPARLRVTLRSADGRTLASEELSLGPNAVECLDLSERVGGGGQPFRVSVCSAQAAPNLLMLNIGERGGLSAFLPPQGAEPLALALPQALLDAAIARELS